MMSTIVDAVLLAALLLTSLRVGSMYRELRKLRAYQSQYLRVFDETKAAVGEIEAAVGALNRDGREVLKRLGGRIDEARDLVARLEALTAEPSGRGASDDVGTYSRTGLPGSATGAGSPRAQPRPFGVEIARAGTDLVAVQPLQPARTFRLAPSVKTLRSAGGAGA